MKRMVNENLIAILKEMDSKGISISDLADVLQYLSIDEDDNLKIDNNINLNNNELQDVNKLQFHDGTFMTTASSGGTFKLYYLQVSWEDIDDNLIYLTIPTDNNSLDSYNDLYTYLVNNGLIMTDNGDRMLNVAGYDGIYGLSASIEEGDEYINVSRTNGDMQLFGNETNLTFTYLND